jgi:hypothetical protein
MLATVRSTPSRGTLRRGRGGGGGGGCGVGGVGWGVGGGGGAPQGVRRRGRGRGGGEECEQEADEECVRSAWRGRGRVWCGWRRGGVSKVEGGGRSVNFRVKERFEI